MMFISHYDKTCISCTDNQFNTLFYTVSAIFKSYGRPVFVYHILTALFESDDAYYSAKYLFKSKKSEEELYPRYCNLAKLIYIYLTDIVYHTELNAIVSSLAIKKIPLDMIEEVN